MEVIGLLGKNLNSSGESAISPELLQQITDNSNAIKTLNEQVINSKEYVEDAIINLDNKIKTELDAELTEIEKVVAESLIDIDTRIKTLAATDDVLTSYWDWAEF